MPIENKKHEIWRRASLKYYYTKKGKKIREIYLKKNMIKTKKYQRGLQKRYRNKYRRIILEVFKNQCKVCGFKDIRALQIDHVNGGGKMHIKNFKGNRWSYYKKISEEILNGSKDYQILCANYNWIKKVERGE